jgi:hypothetical protein
MSKPIIPLGELQDWGFKIRIRYTCHPPNIVASVFSRDDDKKAAIRFYGKNKQKLIHKALAWIEKNKDDSDYSTWGRIKRN